MSRIAGSHEILRIEDLLDEFGNGHRSVRLVASRRQRGETGNEEMKTRKGNHVRRQLPQIGVQLAGKTQAGRGATERRDGQMIQIAERRRRQFQRAKTNVVESFVVNAKRFVGIL